LIFSSNFVYLLTKIVNMLGVRMSKSSSSKVISWRRRTKTRMVESMGGSCQICGYNKCQGALEFHHINPFEKTISFGKVRANAVKWDIICDELKKCILLCSNCHKEVESGLIGLPQTYKQFDESFRDYKLLEGTHIEQECAECKNLFRTLPSSKQKYCSQSCSKKHFRKVQRPSRQTLLNELKTMSYVAVGRKYGVSDNAIRKWLK
jgi:hypothetical protein